MKLLLDENLSYRLAGQLQPLYPGAAHVDSVELHGRADSTIWDFARDNSFVISKDDDFRQLSVLRGALPKVIWLSVGNAVTSKILEILNQQYSLVEAFVQDAVESLLVLQLPEGSS